MYPIATDAIPTASDNGAKGVARRIKDVADPTIFIPWPMFLNNIAGAGPSSKPLKAPLAKIG